MTMKLKVGILGGSFDPVHNMHIRLAEAAHDEYQLSKVIFMPNALVYYKERKSFIMDSDRLQMLRLAVKGIPYAEVSSMEIDRGGITYTIDTVNDLLDDHPDFHIFFIIGGDSLKNLSTWKEYRSLLRKVTFLAAVRDDIGKKESEDIISGLRRDVPETDIRVLDIDGCGISSSDIRMRISKGLDVSGLIDPEVRDYIEAKALYRDALD